MDHNQRDTDLVNRIQAGDTDAMSLLYRKHRPALYRYAYSRVYNQELAQDIVGEIFLKVVQYLPQYKVTGAPFTAWLFRIAHNTLITLSQKESKQMDVPLEYVENSIPSEDRPDLQVENRLNVELIMTGLHALEEMQREVVVLRFLVGLSIKETAHSLEKSIGAIKTLQHRGIHALRVALNVKQEKVA